MVAKVQLSFEIKREGFPKVEGKIPIPDLQSLVATFFGCTTIHPLVVLLYIHWSYDCSILRKNGLSPTTFVHSRQVTYGISTMLSTGIVHEDALYTNL